VLAKQKRRWVGPLVAISAGVASFDLGDAGSPARSQTPTAPDRAEQPATPESRPIPGAGPLAQPKSLDQVGLPVELTRRAIPSDNPQTPEKIVLGEKLFFDGRLSADGTVACSTCHDPARAFTDGRTTSMGIKGGVGQRNAPTILPSTTRPSSGTEEPKRSRSRPRCRSSIRSKWVSRAWMPP
jgi:hypothetical protein